MLQPDHHITSIVLQYATIFCDILQHASDATTCLSMLQHSLRAAACFIMIQKDTTFGIMLHRDAAGYSLL